MTRQPLNAETPDAPAKVVVLVVSYNGTGYLGDCLSSVLVSADPGVHTRVLVVDNGSNDATSRYVAGRFPQVDLIRIEPNRGFAGGNNAGWDHVRKHWPDTEFLVLLNQDTIVQSGWLAAMVAMFRTEPSAGAVQPKLMMHPATDRFNSAGNASHFLGFGFVGHCGQTDRGQFDTPRPIGSASGAAVMLRCDLLARTGLFEPTMFMYLEDAELNWRLRQLGTEPYLAPGATVLHKYKFQSNFRYYFHLEKNRWWMLLAHYRLPTLLLLAPALALMEAGQFAFAASHGLAGEKLRSWRWLLRPASRRRIARARRRVQKTRLVSDRTLTRRFCGTIDFPEMNSPLLRRVANPLLAAYWAVARRLIFW